LENIQNSEILWLDNVQKIVFLTNRRKNISG